MLRKISAWVVMVFGYLVFVGLAVLTCVVSRSNWQVPSGGFVVFLLCYLTAVIMAMSFLGSTYLLVKLTYKSKSILFTIRPTTE